MSNVTFIRPETKKLLPLYSVISDCLEGEVAVKSKRDKYLPIPNSEDRSDENKACYDSYLTRALFYNVARRTLSGLIGQIFMVEPIIKMPSTLKVLESNISGTGIGLVQQCKQAASYTLAYSRAGLFTDYPETPNGAATVADLQSGRVRPTVTLYHPANIVNWRVVDRGAEEILSLVVLVETYAYADDGFEMKLAVQLREMRLVELEGRSVVLINIWREELPTEFKGNGTLPTGNFKISSRYYPKDASGVNLTEIPFDFIGSDNNDVVPDYPNFYDLCAIDLAHYRNSADYEQNVFQMSQATPVLSGVPEGWVKDELGGRVSLGSAGGFALPVGAKAELLQASENNLAAKAMEHKERQMTALGAKLVEQKTVQRTAFETKIEATSEGSTLLSVAKNVEAAYLNAFKRCANYAGADENSIQFELNTDFDISQMTADERNEIVQEYEAGLISFTECRTALRKVGIAFQNDDVARTEIEKDKKAAVERQQMTAGVGIEQNSSKSDNNSTTA